MPTWIWLLVTLGLSLLAMWLWLRGTNNKAKHSDFDPKSWQPHVVRPLTLQELDALKQLQTALPQVLYFPQISISRFVGVKTKKSYARWFNRVGRRSVDFLACSSRGDVLGVIELKTKRSPSSAGELKTSTLAMVSIPLWHLDLERRGSLESVTHDLRQRLAEAAAISPRQTQSAQDGGWQPTIINPRVPGAALRAEGKLRGIEAIELTESRWQEQDWPTEDNRPSSFLDGDSNFAPLIPNPFRR